MRSRSSIFSSDTLATSLRPTGAVLLALVLCGVFRVLIGWAGPSYTGLVGYWLVDTDMGYARVQMRQPSENSKPRCLVLGSSRIGLGIHAPTLAEELGWQVVKTPVSVGTPWTFLYMFETEPQLLEGVEAMVIDVEYFQFNDNSPVREGLRYDRLAVLEDWDQRLWPLDRERREFMEVVKGVSLDVTDGAPYRPMHERWKRYDANGRKDPGMLPEPAARRVAENFEFSEWMVDIWEELSMLCAEYGIDLYVIHPPVMGEFLTQLDGWQEWIANRDRVRRAIAAIDSLPATTVFYTERLADVGLADEDAMLMDYGHMTGAGARAYTKWLSEEIRELLAANRPDGDVGATAGS